MGCTSHVLVISDSSHDHTGIFSGRNVASVKSRLRGSRVMADRCASDCSNEWRKVEEEVTCPVCEGLFVEPKTTISCLHTFCRKCIRMIINNSDSRDCPVCKEHNALPQDYTKIPTNSTLQLKADMVRKRNERKCGECELIEDYRASMVMWCVDCDSYLCRECDKQHKRMNIFKSHKMMTIEQFKAQSPNIVFASRHPEYRICKYHNKPLDVYCRTCNITICQMCVTKIHNQHHYDFVNKVADEKRDNVKVVVAQLEAMMKEVKNHIGKVENADNELNNETDTERQIQNMHGQQHQKLLAGIAIDLEKVKAVKRTLQILLNSQKENLKCLLTCISSCSEYIHDVVMPTKEVTELQECYDYVQKTVDDLANQVQSSLKPVYGVDHLILSTTSPVPYMSIRVSTLPHLPNCTVKGPLAMSKYGPVCVTIVLKDEDGRPVPNQTEHLMVHFKDETISNNVKVEEEEFKEVYTLSYNVNKRETHNLSVSWKGQHLGKITVQAKIRDYSAVKNPIHEPITNYGKQNELCLNDPHLMALGPNDELIVCDCHTKTLVVFDSDLKFSHTIAVGEPPPTGLAISKGYLYISTNHVIKKVQMDGELVFKFGGKGTENGKFNSPCGLINKSDRLYVCDKNNHRIQVLQESHFLFSFGKNGKHPGMFNEPHNLAFNNSEDLLFIADSGNHRIQLFTPSGQFLKVNFW